MNNKLYSVLLFLIASLCQNSANAGVFFGSENQISCINEVKSNSNFDLLKINFRMEASNFVRYTNQLTINDEERSILPSYLASLDDCVKKFSDENERTLDPVINSIYKNAYNFYLEQSARLYNHEINYGEFNKVMDNEFAEQDAALSQREAKIEQANNASNAAFSSQAMEGVRQIERAFNPPPQRTTNCYALGNVVRCNTR